LKILILLPTSIFNRVWGRRGKEKSVVHWLRDEDFKLWFTESPLAKDSEFYIIEKMFS
jgi:hypothetical protein